MTDIQLRGIPGVVQVRHAERSGDRRSWKFLVDVAASELLSRPERLFYDVRRADESLTGEIHCRLQPARGKHLRLAATLGVAISLQGLAALGKFLAKADYSLDEAVSHFHIASDYQLFFPLCIPLLWALLALYDRLQYRLQN